jgi:hypothetical protein
MYNNITYDILPVSKDYIENAIDFDKVNKKEIEEIKNIFLKNLDKHNKNKFINLINYDNYESEKNEDIQILSDYKIENTIKEYVTISMIKSEKNNKHNIILFIPTNDDNIKTKINEYLNKKNKELIKNIIYGDIDLYKNPNNIDEEDGFI